MSTRRSFFKSDLPCCWIEPSVFWPSPSRVFFVNFLLLLLLFCFVFSESDLLCIYSVLPIYWVRSSLSWVSPSGFSVSSSHFLRQSFPIKSNFLGKCFLFFDSDFTCFNDVSPSHFFGSVFPFFSLPPSSFYPFWVLIWSPCTLSTELKK